MRNVSDPDTSLCMSAMIVMKVFIQSIGRMSFSCWNMNELERMKQLSSARKLKEREETPVPFADPYSDMTPEEKSKMIIALMAARERDAERI